MIVSTIILIVFTIRCLYFLKINITNALLFLVVFLIISILSIYLLLNSNTRHNMALHHNNSNNIIVGTSGKEYPLIYMNNNGIPEGLAVDVIEIVARHMNKEVFFIQLPPVQLENALQDGEIDIIVDGIAWNKTNLDLVHFSNPYLYLPLVFFGTSMLWH